MNPDSKTFLKRLVETPSPSGYEQQVQRLVRERIAPWCDEVKTDVMGNVFGIRNPAGRPRVMLAGHCDQIGFIVQFITESGFIYVDRIGGVDPTVAVSQRVVIMTRRGLVPGVIGRKVQNCHPPASVHKVQQIIDAFRAGDRSTAEFWIELGGKYLHIRYFAVRDASGAYRGVVETAQDVSGIRALEGQRRLLDW